MSELELPVNALREALVTIRNKLLAEAFYLTGDIERYGTGFVRIRRYLQDPKHGTCPGSKP